jgi:hypothetical protein
VWKTALCKEGKVNCKAFKFLQPRTIVSFLKRSNSVVKINVKCSGIYRGRWGMMVVAGVLITLSTTE